MDISEVDQCINCGICSSECPTYVASKEELFSPRGRLLLLQEVTKGARLDQEILRLSMDSCISCGACQTGCPLNVNAISLLKYGKKISATDRELKINKEWSHQLTEFRKKYGFYDSDNFVLQALKIINSNIKAYCHDISDQRVLLLKGLKDTHHQMLQRDLLSAFDFPFEWNELEDTGLGGENHPYFYNNYRFLAENIIQRKCEAIYKYNPSILVILSPDVDPILLEQVSEIDGLKVMTIFELLLILEGNDKI